MFELSGVNYEEVLEQGDSILVRVIASSSYRGFELLGLYCTCIYMHIHAYTCIYMHIRANTCIYMYICVPILPGFHGVGAPENGGTSITTTPIISFGIEALNENKEAEHTTLIDQFEEETKRLETSDALPP